MSDARILEEGVGARTLEAGGYRTLEGVPTAGTTVLLEPFNDFTAWTTVGTPTIVTGRTGTAMQAVGTTARAEYSLAANENQYVTIGAAWRTTTTSTTQRVVFELWSDTNTVRHTRLIHNGTTTQTLTAYRDSTALGTSSTGLIPVNTWAYIELQAGLDDTTGTILVRVNGTVVLNLTSQDTRTAGTKTVYDTVRVGTLLSGPTNQWDDLYIAVGAGAAFKGDITIP